MAFWYDLSLAVRCSVRRKRPSTIYGRKRVVAGEHSLGPIIDHNMAEHRDLFPVISTQPAISVCSDSPQNSQNAIRSHVLNAASIFHTPAFDLDGPPSTSFLIILLALFSALLKMPAYGRPYESIIIIL